MFYKISKSLTLLTLSSALFSGCASIFGDNTRNISIKSNPSGAKIFIDNVQYGTTPSIISLTNYIYSGKVISLKKEGYETQSTMINSKFQPVGLWNILFWPGFLIDAAAGNTVKIDPQHLNVDLTLETEERKDLKAKN